jgi:hypothetical protein
VTSFLTALVVLVSGVLVLGAVSAATAEASSSERSFTSRLNGARAANGVPRLRQRADLVAVARNQARRMASSTRLYHNPRLTSEVRNWRWVGENVGYGPDVAAVHRAFMNSAPHRRNILDRDYTEIGVGVVRAGGRVWVAEVFRKPMRAAKVTARKGFRPVRFGTTGNRVERIQGKLGVPRSGWYGPVTRKAVRSYKLRQGWNSTGRIVGKRMWRRLF